jgi:hypothetical protein
MQIAAGFALEAEIDELDEAVVIDDEVVRLDISVYDATLGSDEFLCT